MTSQNNVEHLAVMHVDLSITRQPEAHQSIRAGVSLPVFVRPEDDVLAILDNMFDKVESRIHIKIDDEYQAHGKKPVYYTLHPAREEEEVEIQLGPDSWDVDEDSD